MDSAHQYDVFLSYAWEDITLAVRFQEELEARGLTVFRDVTGMRDYDDIPEVIRAAIDGSRTLVALYTPSFPESQYCRWELHTALTRAFRLPERTRRVMAVVRGMRFSQVLPGRLTCLRLPPVAAALDEIADSVHRTVTGMDGHRFGDAPEPPEPSWYPVPAVGSQDFRGRLPELWRTRDALDGDDGAGNDAPSVVFLVGGGGIGKTMLAEQYGRLFAADHPGGVFVVRALGSHPDSSRDPERVRVLVEDQIRAITERLGLMESGAPAARARAALGAHLEAMDQPYLWIVDDLPSGVGTDVLRALIAPTARGKTLITSRHAAPGGQGVRVDVGELDELDALALLTSRRPAAPGGERQAARNLVKALGGHPLALAVSAELVALPDVRGFQGLLESFAEPGPDVLESAGRLGVELPTAHATSICATLLRGTDRLAAAGRTVVLLASLLAPAPLSPDLLAEILVASGEDGSRAAGLVRDGLAEAGRLALARTAGGGSWTFHALVGRVVRLADYEDVPRERARRAAVTALGERLAGPATGDGRARIAEALPHVRMAAGPPVDQDGRNLVNEAGRVHTEAGDPAAGLALFRTLHAGCRTALGDGDLTTLRVLAELAVAHGLCGEHETALRLKQEAHQGLAALLGARHDDTLIALNNVGVTHFDLGAYESARQVFSQVYRIRVGKDSIQHPETLQALAGVAAAASKEGRHALALRLRGHLLARTGRVLGTRHPRYADALNAMGASAYARGRSAEAADWFDRAHRLRLELYGPEHGDTLDALENALVARGGEEAAGFREVYRQRVDLQGPAHPSTVTTLRHCVLSLRPQAADAGPGGRLPDLMEPADSFPPGAEPGRVRLDAADMDARVELFEWACAAHESAAHPGKDALVVQLWLAHATALMDQFDDQREVALAIAEDSETGLVRELGRGHPLTRTATSVHRWIERLVDEAVESG
ncbi:FxSxx-COOH system tetratricopeptide repeat protein [Streptomyces drozdowiczii]|uniref:tetratricopeptide repeat protein n=1 Tax=Streptomyces drozdowiczii TaxID=202862 RepID=UPI0031E5E18E